MKKGLQILLTLTLLVQQFLLMPISAIAEEWSSHGKIEFLAVKLVDEAGEDLVGAEKDDEVIVELQWQTSRQEATERTLYLPDELRAYPGSQGFESDTGEEAGNYILKEKQITLSTLEAEDQASGVLHFRAVFEPGEQHEDILTFRSGDDEWHVSLQLTDPLDQNAEPIEDVEEAVMTESEENGEQKQTDEVTPSKEPSENIELTTETPSKAPENKEDKDSDKEEAKSDGTEEATSSLEEVFVTEKQEKTDVGKQLQFSEVTFTDKNGNQFSGENPYDLDATPLGRLAFDWFLKEGHTASNGDTYTFQLPDEFRPASGTSDLLGDIGTWSVNAAGLVTFLFNEAVDGDEVSGNFWFEVSLDEDALSEAIEQEIAFDLEPDFTVSFPVTPKNSNLIDKQGTINNEGFNSTEAFWTVDINTALKEMSQPVVTDVIPEQMAFKADSLVVTALRMTPQGDRIEEDVLDPALYSHTDSTGELIIDLNGLKEEQLHQAYRLTYATEIVEPEAGFDGSQTFTNKATLSTDGSTYDARSTVSSGYGLAVEKSAPKYNQTDQSFNWTINYNFNEKLIDKGSALLEDTWTPAGAMSLDEKALSVYPVSIDENGKATVSEKQLAQNDYDLTIDSDDSGFKLEFKDTIDRQAYQIRYTTKLGGVQGTGVVETGGSVSNTVKTGTEHTDGSSGSWGQQAVRKRHVNTDVGNKQIDWRISLNQNSYLMENLVLTDDFKEDGLSLIEKSENYSGFALRLLEEDESEFKGYKIVYTEPQANQPGGLELIFTETIDRPLTLDYSTHFERNSDGSAKYSNRATIEWSEGGKDYTSDSGSVSSGNTGLTAANGVKNGRYNAVTKEITWSVHANYARLPIADDFEISDVLPEHQEWVSESFDIFTYEVSANGTIVNEEPLDETLYSLSFTEGETEAFSLKLAESLTGEKQAVGIRFATAFNEGWVRDAEVENTAEVVNNGETISLDASVQIPFGGVFADKNGTQTGEFSERIDWEIFLNPNRSVVSDFKLSDTPDLNSQLLTDSFVLYEASVNEAGQLTKTDNVLTEGEEYELYIDSNQETGEQSFELSFSEEINQAYILTYSSYIDPLVNKGEAISNAFTVEGFTTEYRELTEDEVNVYKSNAGGGDGSSIRGNLVIQKADPNGKDLSGAVFSLYTRDGEQLLRSGKTDSDGRVQFGGLRRGRYLLKEVKAPDRYVISQDLAEGVEIELDHEEDQGINRYDVVNRKTRVTVTKVSKDGPIAAAVVFSVLDENKQVIRESLTAENGQLILDDLDPGTYYLREDKAPEGYIVNTDLLEFTVVINEDGTQPIPNLTMMNYQGTVAWEKTDNNGKPLSGAVFEIRNNDTEHIRTVKSDQSGKVEVSGLAPGEYTVKETKAADGYILDKTVKTFTIEAKHAGEPAAVELDDWINHQGTVRLIKEDEQGEPLEGAVFELRQGDELLSEASTNTEGQITVTGLTPGTYTFTESASPDGYILNSESISFTVAAEHEGEPELIVLDEFINYQGKATLTKTDESGEPLEGAAFELRDSDGLLIRGDLLSDGNGLVQVDGLAPGSYTFVETDAPSGYILNTDKPITFEIAAVQSGEAVHVDAGERINYKGSATLLKTDADGEPLAGAVFELKNAEGDSLRDTLVSDEDGVVTLENLTPGDYTVSEKQAPDGFIRNTKTVTFTIPDEANGKPELLNLGTLINYQGQVRLEKVSETGEPLSDAVFALTTDEGERVDTLTSDLDGMVVSGPLSPGNYLLQEVDAPDGYILNNEVLSFTIPEEIAGEPQPIDLAPFTNYQGSVELVKTDAQGNPLEGASFTLLNEETVVSDTITSDSEGRVSIDQLAPGRYTLKETEALEGFILNTETVAFEIEASAEGRPEVVDLDTFVNYKGSVRLHKSDVTGQPLEGAQFNLMKDETVVSVHTTDENGDITVDNLTPGTYAFIETDAPQGYSINTRAVDFEIHNASEGEPELLILDDFINYKGSAVLEKTDSLGEPLSGAVFELRDDEGYLIDDALESDEDGLVYAEDLAPGSYRFVETEAPDGYLLNTEETDLFTIDASFEGELPRVETGSLINYTATAEWMKTDAAGEPLADAVFELRNADGEIVRSELISDENGRVTVDELAPGEYTLIETRAPSGFIVNKETVTFDVAAQAEGEPETLKLDDYVNYQGSIEIWKTDDSNEGLELAVFDLIDADGQLVYDDLVTDPDGRVKVEGLAPGDYSLIETAAPDGYVLAEEPVAVTITDEFEGRPETLIVQVINEQVETDPTDEQEADDDEADSNETLPQTSVSSFTLLTRLLGLGLLTIGLYVLKKKTENN